MFLAESKQGNVPSFTRSGKKYSMSERLKELQRKQSQVCISQPFHIIIYNIV